MMGRSFSLYPLMFEPFSNVLPLCFLLSYSRCSLILSSLIRSARVPEFLFTEEEDEEEGHSCWWRVVKPCSSVFLLLLCLVVEVDPVLRRGGERLSRGEEKPGSTMEVVVVVELGGEGRERELTSRFLC